MNFLSNFKQTLFFVLPALLIGCGDNYTDIILPAKKSKKGDYGYVDLNGKIVVDFEINEKPSIMYNEIGYYNKDKKIVFIDVDGKETKTSYETVLLFNEDLALVVEDQGKLKYINKEFKEVLRLDDFDKAGYFSEGLAKVQNKRGKWGFIDKEGKVVIKLKYDYVESFNEGYAMVKNYDEETRTYLRGIINKKGEEIIRLNDKYSSLSGIYEGLAVYEENDEVGYINLNGEEVIKDYDWDGAFPFHDGYASILEDWEYGLVDKKGNVIIRPREKVQIYFSSSLAVYKDGHRYGYKNMDKEIIINAEYKDALPFLGKGAYVKDGSDWILIDKNGKHIVKNLELKYLYYEELDHLKSCNKPFDIEETLESEYVDTDGFLSVVLSSFGDSYLGAHSNSTAYDVLTYISNTSGFYSKYQVSVDDLKDELSTWSKDIYSYSLLGSDNSFEYDNHFSFTIKYYFDNKVMTKDSERTTLNNQARIKKIRLNVNLRSEAYYKNKKIKEQISQLLNIKGFDYDENSNKYFNNKKNVSIVLNNSSGKVEVWVTFVKPILVDI